MLIPDLKATKEINLTVLYFERSVDNAQFVLDLLDEEEKKVKKPEVKKAPQEEKKEAKKILKAAQKALKEFKPNGSDPTITVGYLPPPKLTELRNEGLVSVRDEAGEEFDPKKVSAGFLNRSAELSREYIRWGVKGHKNISGFPFETETAHIGSKEYEVADTETVHVYEAMDNSQWFNWIANEVIKFNRLDDSKKKQSSPQSGTSPQNSTVNSAKANPSSGKTGDAANPES